LKALPVETDSDFPNVIDIIKSGYVDSTYDMIDGMFTEVSETIH